MPDMVVVQRAPECKPGSTAVITNPYVIVQVLSPSTHDFDLSEKLPNYKQIGSLQQIIFVSQKNKLVMSYSRSEQPGVWLNQDFFEGDAVLIQNMPVTLEAIYEKVQFNQ